MWTKWNWSDKLQFSCNRQNLSTLKNVLKTEKKRKERKKTWENRRKHKIKIWRKKTERKNMRKQKKKKHEIKEENTSKLKKTWENIRKQKLEWCVQTHPAGNLHSTDSSPPLRKILKSKKRYWSKFKWGKINKLSNQGSETF